MELTPIYLPNDIKEDDLPLDMLLDAFLDPFVDA